MTDLELGTLLADMESDRVERKESISDPSKIRQAICAFANDMPGHGGPGVVFIGAKDDGRCAGLKVTDELLRQLADMRSDGNILPLPAMTVEKRTLAGCELAVVAVEPSLFPPVRLKGRVWIRIGPRRATASAEEERRLNERRRSKDLPYDLHPVGSASPEDLDQDLFKRVYLPSAVAAEVLRENQRSLGAQMMSLRFLGTEGRPTVMGVLTVGKQPASAIGGAYVQFLRIEGTSLADPIADQKEIHGPLPELMRRIDDILDANIHVATDIRSAPTERRSPDYPMDALQQLLRNAVMHRSYENTNAPVRLYWFSDRIEIQNPGGPYGQVTRENFGRPDIADYRNPNLAEAMRNLGFVQRFGVGIQIARQSLAANGNPVPDFDVQDTHVLATIRRRGP